jgi:8-oxo-dGTP pyrophosphatase MutT (NUDIX family)
LARLSFNVFFGSKAGSNLGNFGVLASMNDDLPALISARLNEPLPGEMAQYRMAPAYRSRGSFREIDTALYRLSAVIILLCRRQNGEWFIPLTLRREYVGAHSAQVSLPGGKKDEADKTLADTALRECYEEIGISGTINILGELSTLHIPVSKYIVHPFVAINTNAEINYRSHEREVDAIIEMPVKVLLEPATEQSGEIAIGNNQKTEAPFFLIQGHKVWGATAMILSELKRLLKPIFR